MTKLFSTLRSIEVFLRDDLVDSSKAGDRIRTMGIFCCVPTKNGGFTSGSFKTILIANNLIVSRPDTPQLSSHDVNNIRRLSNFPNIINILSNSIAPSINGFLMVKRAVLCLLLGGVEKNLQNGIRLRGDINILLIGNLLKALF